MDGFSGFKTATTEELPEAVPVLDPFHVVRLAGEALDECRRRVQQHLHGHRGRKGDPLYSARRTLHTGAALLTDKQQERLDKLFANAAHLQVELTWGAYQAMITAYRETDRKQAATLMRTLIDSLAAGVPAPLVELRKLGVTLAKRAEDVLAYFDRPRTSNGPTDGTIDTVSIGGSLRTRGDEVVTLEIEQGGAVNVLTIGGAIEALGSGSTRTSIEGEGPAL